MKTMHVVVAVLAAAVTQAEAVTTRPHDPYEIKCAWTESASVSNGTALEFANIITEKYAKDEFEVVVHSSASNFVITASTGGRTLNELLEQVRCTTGLYFTKAQHRLVLSDEISAPIVRRWMPINSEQMAIIESAGGVIPFFRDAGITFGDGCGAIMADGQPGFFVSARQKEYDDIGRIMAMLVSRRRYLASVYVVHGTREDLHSLLTSLSTTGLVDAASSVNSNCVIGVHGVILPDGVAVTNRISLRSAGKEGVRDRSIESRISLRSGADDETVVTASISGTISYSLGQSHVTTDYSDSCYIFVRRPWVRPLFSGPPDARNGNAWLVYLIQLVDPDGKVYGTAINPGVRF